VINIRPDFSTVELPANMDPSVLEKLRDTRISGRLIEIKPDRGPRGGARRDGDRFERRDRPSYGDRDDRPARGDRDDRTFRKPRHKD
jgi:ATP-dependent RNA helicase DeaD